MAFKLTPFVAFLYATLVFLALRSIHHLEQENTDLKGHHRLNDCIEEISFKSLQ